ncbi:PAS domain S-box protein [Desulfomonile tiedjei]|uniref:histidine kinase n=1 Tax=Desulfomonile tiedjei (strain ATCC 49306 / DSM 6799 / DCB-1) TaxID=706587 RepID=I4C8M7_DESTA|nr:PAS domain S-box protein [Desulfomonile tiedjei]AFM25918.1 PAS domain S-box [Desulfomonile tiedjei DSM 6799]
MVMEMETRTETKILIAEDEAIVGEDLARILREFGYQIVGIASKGEEAVRMADELKPALILMDIKLAGYMDGIQAAEQIRVELDIPVIFVTAYEEEDVLSRAKRAQPYGYLTKPFSNHILKITIDTALLRHAADKRLRESEERFSKSFENNPAFLAIVQMSNWEMLEVNDAWTKVTGYTREEAIGRTPVQLGIYDDETYREIMAEARAKGSVRNAEIVSKNRNGEDRVLLVSREVIRIKDEPYLLAMGVDITDRKRAEETIKQSEKRYRSLFENILEGYVFCQMIFDGDSPVDFVFLEANPAFEKLTCLKNVVGKRASEVMSGLKQKDLKLIEICGRVALTGKPEKHELYVHSLSSWFSASLYSPQKGYFVSVFDNITERKHAENALSKSEQFLRQTEQIARVGGWIANPLTNAFHWTDGFRRIIEAPFGYQPDLEEGLKFFTPPYIPIIKKLLIHTLESGNPQEMEAEAITASGRHLWTEIKFLMRVDESGGPQVLGTIQDITERKQVEKDRTRLVTAIEQAAETVLITDTDGTVVYVNPAFERVTGYSRDEVLGLNPRILKSGHQDVAFYKRLWETIANGKTWNGFLIDRRKDGTIVHTEATISPVKDMSGNIVNFVAVQRDVTEELKLQRQLAQAQKMEAVGVLAGGIAHDFNNLLQVTLGFSEILLEEKKETDPEYRDLQKIFQAATSGAELVRQLLTFSRKVEPKTVPLDLTEPIMQIKKFLNRTIPKMIDIRINVSGDLAEVDADPTQIEQILMNLAVNARDAMPEGGTLTITARNETLDSECVKCHPGVSPGDYVLLAITDTGTGMDTGIVEHIFEPFFTTKEIGRGTGLGLAMVYGIVKQHGGHITCQSDVAQGTTFKIYLPAIRRKTEPVTESSEEMPAHGTETVLLVDDEESVRELGTRILARSGYTVLTATNGVEALDLYTREKDDITLVILDLIMPILGGKDCLKRILQINPQARMLIASGYSGDISIKECLDLGARGFVSKPFRYKELLRQVRKTLDGS